MNEYNYLSDNELERLIADIEENDIVKAPPHFKQEIIERIDKRKQIIEYKRFRNRVIASVLLKNVEKDSVILTIN